MFDDTNYRQGVLRFIRFRWMASVTALAVSTAAFVVLAAPGFLAAIIVSILIAASNLAHFALARTTLPVRMLLLIQFIADLVLLTAFLGAAGYPGPLVSLYLFHVVLGALLLERKDALAIFGIAVALSAVLTWGWYMDLGFPSHSAGFFALIFPAGWSPGSSGFTMRFPALFAAVAAVVLVLILPLADDVRKRGRELQKAERRAHARAEGLNRILDSAGAAMMLLDETHHVVWLNRIAERWFPEFAVGLQRPCYDPTESASVAERECLTCRVLRENTAWRGDHTLAVPDGEPRVFRVYATPIAEPGGARMVAELVLDVTVEHATEQQLHAERKAAAITRFAAGVAHELNTPLASIAAGLRLVRRRMDEDLGGENDSEVQTLSIVDDLATQTERCQQVTQSILDYSRQQRSRLEAVEVRAIVNRAFDGLRNHRDLTGIDVVAEVCASGPRPSGADVEPGARSRDSPAPMSFDEAEAHDFPAVYCDPTQLQLVLTNILTNAVDSVHEAGREAGRIRVHLHASDRFVEIRVRDNGHGIPVELRKQIFEPFFTTKASGRGTGLGLPVARGLLDGMGGSIEIRESDAGVAEIVVRLPTTPPEPLNDDAAGTNRRDTS